MASGGVDLLYVAPERLAPDGDMLSLGTETDVK